MRTVSADFNTSLSNVDTTFARLWKITRVDGKVITLTDHDSNVLYNGEVYIASAGFTSTSVLTSALSIGSQSVELTVPLTDLGVTELDLRHRIYERAAAVEYVIDYDNPDHGVMTLFTGIVGRVVMSDKKRATVEVISATDPNIYVAGENYSASCRNDLGDSNCQFPIFNIAFTATVATVVDTMAFTVDTLSGQDDDFFALGQIKWLTGANAGLVSDIRTSSLGLLSIGLFYPMAKPIAVGDTGQIIAGCDKQLTTCLKKFNNVINFRGEPFAPSFGG